MHQTRNELIVVVKKILVDIRSFEMIDLEIYESNLEIFHSYIKKIRVTPTIHKYLCHSVQIISFFFHNTYQSGMGIWTEECIESLIRKFRSAQCRSSKTSRQDLNLDTMKNLWA